MGQSRSEGQSRRSDGIAWEKMRAAGPACLVEESSTAQPKEVIQGCRVSSALHLFSLLS